MGTSINNGNLLGLSLLLGREVNVNHCQKLLDDRFCCCALVSFREYIHMHENLDNANSASYTIILRDRYLRALQ